MKRAILLRKIARWRTMSWNNWRLMKKSTAKDKQSKNFVQANVIYIFRFLGDSQVPSITSFWTATDRDSINRPISPHFRLKARARRDKRGKRLWEQLHLGEMSKKSRCQRNFETNATNICICRMTLRAPQPCLITSSGSISTHSGIAQRKKSNKI